MTMNNKAIIFSTLAMLFVSFMFLAFVEKNQADINTKNVWMIYFENPKDKSLNFIIENHSNSENFILEIFADKISVTKGDIIIKKGEQKTIPVPSNGIENKKITIRVTSGDNKKEIFKSL